MICDEEDKKKLFQSVIKQAIDDYIKLQHPKSRMKKHLSESFGSAIDMLFDNEYRMLYIKNELGEEMSLKDLVAEMLGSDQVDIEQMRNHVVEEAQTFWETKEINTIYIPNYFIVDGHVYQTVDHDDDPQVNYDEKLIFIRKDSDNSVNQEDFCKLSLEILAYHLDMSISKQKLDQLGASFFRMMRTNSCFTGDR